MKRSLITTTLTAILLLAGCSSPTNDASPNFEPATTTEATPADQETSLEESDTEDPISESSEDPVPDFDYNERGSVVMEPGDTEILTNDDGTELMSFTVDSIEVNPDCTAERSREPENGNFVVFEAEVESDIVAGEHGLKPGRTFNSSVYRVIDEDGNTLGESPNTGPSHSCFPDIERIPTDLGPGEKGSGKVVFDVSVDSGSLLLELDAAQGLQWEWEF